MPELTNKVITHMTVYVDDSSHNVPAYIYAKQYDARSRFLVIKIMSASGQIRGIETARFNAILPDSSGIYINGIITETDEVVIGLTQGLLSLPGKIACDVETTRTEGGEMSSLTTSTFYIVVDKSNYGEESIESIDGILTSLMPARFVSEEFYDSLDDPDEYFKGVAVFIYRNKEEGAPQSSNTELVEDEPEGVGE